MDCNATLKKNQFANGETADVKNREVMAQKNDEATEIEYVPRIIWLELSAQIFIHAGCLYGLYLVFTQAKLLTSLWAFITIYASGLGVTAGVHRLWSHKAYKAKWPLRMFLIFLFTITGQKDVYTWALAHRVHHKYSETDADLHNVKRGFFFAHVGWLFTTPHPDVVAKCKAIDMSDLEADPIIMLQKKVNQEERDIFWETIVWAIVKRSLCEHGYYSRILDDATRIKERQAALRETTRNLGTRIVKCIDVHGSKV